MIKMKKDESVLVELSSTNYYLSASALLLGVGTQSDWRYQDAGLRVDCFSLGGGGVKFGLPKGEGKILLFIYVA